MGRKKKIRIVDPCVEALKGIYAGKHRIYRVKKIETGHYIAYFRHPGPYNLQSVTYNKETLEHAIEIMKNRKKRSNAKIHS